MPGSLEKLRVSVMSGEDVPPKIIIHDKLSDEDLDSFIKLIKGSLSLFEKLKPTEIDLSGNELQSFEIVMGFISLFDLSDLSSLKLDNNNFSMFTGDPRNFSKLAQAKALEIIDLSHNKLSEYHIRQFFTCYITVYTQKNPSNAKSSPCPLKKIKIAGNNVDNIDTLHKYIITVFQRMEIDGHLYVIKDKNELRTEASNFNVGSIQIEEQGHDGKTEENDHLLASKNLVPKYGSIDAKSADNLLQNAFQRFNDRYNTLISMLKREQALSPFPQKNSFLAHLKLHSDNFFNGVMYTFGTIIPAIFSILLLHDVIEFYAAPNERYGNTLANIIAGTSTNQASWSSQFGSNLIPLGNDASSSIYFGLFFATMPVLLGTLNLFLSALNTSLRFPTQLALNDSDISQLNETLKSQKGFFHDMVLPKLFPWSKKRSAIKRAEFTILWDGRISFEQRKKLYKELLDLAKEGHFLTQLFGLSALANIADSFKDKDLAKYENYVVTHLKEIYEIRDDALRNLNKTPASGSVPRYLYAKYLLWSLGKLENTWRDSLLELVFSSSFLATTFYTLYANARFIQLLINSGIENANYYQNKTACENANSIWRYMPQSGEYECNVCSDLEELVPYPEMNSVQSCINGLLSQPQSPDYIIQTLNRLALHPDITAVDLSQQDWSSWPLSVWQSFLDILTKIPSLRLTRLNVSSLIVNPTPQFTNILPLVDFVEDTPIEQLIVSNLNVDAANTQLLMNAAANNTALTHMNVSGMVGEDALVANIAQVLRLSHFRSLIMDDVNGTDLGFTDLFAAIPNSTLNVLSARRNLFGQPSIDILGNVLPYSQLTSADFSGVDLNGVDLSPLGQGATQSHLESLIMQECGLSDSEIASFAPFIRYAQFRLIDVRFNQFGNTGCTLLIASMQNTTVTNAKLAGNLMDDLGLSASAEYMDKTNIVDLDISNLSKVTVNGFTTFVGRLSDSQVAILRAENMPQLGDGAGIVVADSISNTTSKLREFYLGGDDIEAQGGLRLAKSIENSDRITHAGLANNQLTPEVAIELAKICKQSANFVFLDVSGNTQLSGKAMKPVVDALPYSSLTNLQMNSISLDPEVHYFLAQQLITPVPNMNELVNEEIEPDLAKAVHNAKPNTHVNVLGLQDTGLTDQYARFYCHIQGSTAIPMSNLSINNNPFNPQNINPNTCSISSASSLEPEMLMTGIKAFILLYLLYRLLS